MKKIFLIIIFIIISVFTIRFFLGGNEDTWICQDGAWIKHGNPQSPMPTTGCEGNNSDNSESKTNLANPASVYCIDNGGTLKFQETDLGTKGLCVLSDGTKCEEWAYYRGECPQNTEIKF